MENRTTDWFFDFSSLPRWDVRDRIPFVYDKFYHLPQSDTLCCIYSIAEVRMGWYQGFLAILKNKEHPELVLNVAEKIGFCDNFSANKNGNIVFLQASVYNKATGGISCPILILDIQRKKFSYCNAENYNPCYRIVEISDHLFGIEADEIQTKKDEHLNALTKQKIDLHTLKWYDFSELNALPGRVNKKGM